MVSRISAGSEMEAEVPTVPPRSCHLLGQTSFLAIPVPAHSIFSFSILFINLLAGAVRVHGAVAALMEKEEGTGKLTSLKMRIHNPHRSYNSQLLTVLTDLASPAPATCQRCQ